MSRPFIILDRDGTIIVEKVYLSDPEQVELLPRAAEGLRQLQQLGFGLVVVTNQSGVGRGYFDLATLDRIHRRLTDLLAAEDVTLDAILTCPHTPDDDCNCRKPRPGLLLAAAAEMDIDLTKAFVIGDKPCDLELGRRVGATTLLVRTGYGAEHEAGGQLHPDYVVDDLAAAGRLMERIQPVRRGVTIS
jgi:D-glycero-D-manno-heptose 1,7-bisphosphate phosphatase